MFKTFKKGIYFYFKLFYILDLFVISILICSAPGICIRVESRKHVFLFKWIEENKILSKDWETTFYLSSKTLSAKFFLTMIPLLFFAANCYSTIKLSQFLLCWLNNWWLLTQFPSQKFPSVVNRTFLANIGCDNFITSFHCFQHKKYHDH